MSERYQLLPALAPDDYELLKASIAEKGVLVPIEVDEHGNVLDGYHRKAIADALGVSYKTITRIGLSESEKRLHAIALNLARRHLTDAQKVMLGRLIEPDIAAVAEQHQLANLRQNRQPRPGSVVPMFEGPPTCSIEQVGSSRNAIARQVGLGDGLTYERGKAVIERAAAIAPDLMHKVQAGELNIRDLRKEVRGRERLANYEQRMDAAREPAPMDAMPKRFAVLYADPPWRYEYAEAENRAVENQYPTLGLMDICQLPVAALAADDAVLFLWATSPKLSEAMRVLEAWGFEYRTCMVWVKDRIGMGYYARQQHELLLIARRGNLPVPLAENRPASVVTAPRLEHSQKPERFYELIERMYPDLPYVELFARRPRSGWTAWGNEAA